MKQKIKIMKHKPDLSDEEIRSYMDFDKLLEARSHATPFISRSKLFVALGVIVIATGVWWYFEIHKPVIDKTVENESPKASVPAGSPIVQADSLLPEMPDSTHRGPLENSGAGSQNSQKSKQIKAKSPRTVAMIPKQNDQSEKSVEVSYVEAEPQNGYPEFYEYLNNTLQYPAESIKDSIQGVETVSFTINAQGKTENIFVRQSLGKAFDEESIRVIQQMPAWKPAVLNGKPVASQISIPLTFHMERLK